MKKVVEANGTKLWYDDSGRLHREKLPAVLYPSGERRWYRNGLLHRKNGPAVEYPDGGYLWYFKNQLHREDGPALYIKWTEDRDYYFHGKLYKEVSSNQEWIRLVRLLVLE